MVRCHLSKLMGEHKHTIQNVHEATGLSRSTLSRLYNETNEAIRYDTIEALCKLYQCDLSDLLSYVVE